MEKSTERRQFMRFSYGAPILFSPADADRYHGSKLYDTSLGGIRFITNQVLSPGAEVRVRKELVPHAGSPPAMDREFSAQVVWCREVASVYDSYYGRYEVGIKFPEPLQQNFFD